jgi:hypothetical protein
VDIRARLDELEMLVKGYPANARPLQIIADLRTALGSHPADDMSGAALIAAERVRQLEKEGWDAAHDDRHDRGELVAAAVCYAADGAPKHPRPFLPGGMVYAAHQRGASAFSFVDPWPWDSRWDKRGLKKPTTRKLAIAGALLAAEIDRVAREQAKLGAKP